MFERWMRFESAETGRRAEQLLATVDSEVCLTNGYCWVDFPEPDYARIGYRGSGYLDKLTALFVCQELAKRFPVVNIGCNERGWTPGKIQWLLDLSPASTANLQAATILSREVSAFFNDAADSSF